MIIEDMEIGIRIIIDRITTGGVMIVDITEGVTTITGTMIGTIKPNYTGGAPPV